MSGFAGVFHLDGAPVERAWLETMAKFLAFRGPDLSQVWISGNAGLCHTLLRTRAEQDNRPQITTLDSNVWITGDIRIDDRETLFAKLSVPSEILKGADSAELVLHAYAKWGEACVEHLLGDFSFVIWDAERRKVFAARDHLGVKPLFYAQVRQCLILSNTLDCVRQVPIVPNELNEYAIGDFLIFGENKNPSATFFTAIHRLPVAHRLSAGAASPRTEKYWSLPIDDPIHYKRAEEYLDHFRQLLQSAVRDRLPDEPLGVFMSGGLDSPAVAATAVQLGATTTAFTYVYDRLIPDRERHYSSLVADYLGVPIHHIARDDEPWGWEPDSPPVHTPEPNFDPLSFIASRLHNREICKHARVFFYGDGPDAALQYEWRPYLNHMYTKKMYGRLCRDLAWDFIAYRRLPLIPTLLRMSIPTSNHSQDYYDESIPTWLNPEFEARLGLKERWAKLRAEKPSPHRVRPKSYSCFECDFPMGGNGGDGGCPGDPPAEDLHPLWDLRLLRFLLAVPAVPWCREKYLVRCALRGIIPEVVRLRPKTALAGLPYIEQARQFDRPKLPSVASVERYVDMTRVPRWPCQSREELDYDMRVLGLHYWLLAL
jgi:asparagine synthase (glutamine-hydrolysing)